MSTKIFHNPRCSKSRQTLALLTERGIEPEVVEYLKTPPSAEDIRKLLNQLGIPARELLRTGEQAYRDAGLDNPDLDDAAVIAAMAEHPILIQRPIVVAGDRARIGRPPEAVLEIIEA